MHVIFKRVMSMMENQAGYYQGFDLLSCLRSGVLLFGAIVSKSSVTKQNKSPGAEFSLKQETYKYETV